MGEGDSTIVFRIFCAVFYFQSLEGCSVVVESDERQCWRERFGGGGLENVSLFNFFGGKEVQRCTSFFACCHQIASRMYGVACIRMHIRTYFV